MNVVDISTITPPTTDDEGQPPSLNRLEARDEQKIIKAISQSIAEIATSIDASTGRMAEIVGGIEKSVLDESLKYGEFYSQIGNDIRDAVALSKKIHAALTVVDKDLSARNASLERKGRKQKTNESPVKKSKVVSFIINGLWFVGFIVAAIASLAMVLGTPK